MMCRWFAIDSSSDFLDGKEIEQSAIPDAMHFSEGYILRE
jgi:hypothetical protein